MANGATDFLTRINTAANDVQEFANALAEKIRAGGTVAVRASNTAYGAAAGAKAGSVTPTEIPPAIKWAGLAAVFYFLSRK